MDMINGVRPGGEATPSAAARAWFYDLFHGGSLRLEEVVDRVRVEQANALKSDKPARKRVKAALLLPRNRAS